MEGDLNFIQYRNGGHQLGILRGYETINLFNKKINFIAVYQNQPNGRNLFLTTCELNKLESDHLEASHRNFVTEQVLENQNSIINIQNNKQK